VALPFLLRTVGTVAASNSVAQVAGGFDIRAAGSDIGGRGESFGFQSQFRSGDFDVRARLAALELSDGYAKAGWMARATLDTNSPFAAAFATPSLGGCYFQHRAAVAGAADSAGSLPVNFPYTWLRLQRVGDVFTGLASLDGDTWVRLGSATVVMPGTVYVGFAVTSHDPTNTVTASFRDGQTASGGTVVSNLPLPFEPLGPCSRRTGLVISEIMYHPPKCRV